MVKTRGFCKNLGIFEELPKINQNNVDFFEFFCENILHFC